MHISVPVDATVELLNFSPINPLISKCQIKVCYVGDAPNRNGSVITKDVATEMAKSLPGCPIVGFFNESTGDFEEHNRVIDVSNGRFEVIDTTRPYGFVDLGAKVWFQKFLDDGVEHEYLMTEGYIWTEVYPEAQRIISEGNNQSMELFEKNLSGSWTSGDNGEPQFFIINEAIIQKLCILGKNVEPCFEGAGIAAQFALDDDFKTKLYSMVQELQLALQEGGKTQMENEKILPEEEFKNEEDVPSEEQPLEEVHYKAEEEDDDEEEKCPECGKPLSECECDDEEDEKKKYSLEEYTELQNQFSELKSKFEALEAEIVSLREFKAAADRKEKQAMIDSFYMLSDSDKADVISNIDTYSIDDIEAKLAIICVRNKVNFNLDDDKPEDKKEPVIYSLGNDNDGSDNAPAWIKAVRETAKNMI